MHRTYRYETPFETPFRQRRQRARVLPRDDDQCGWMRMLPPPPPARRLDSALRADCAVIGAGFTGLAVARRLAELRPDWRVVLVDAQRAGGGGSGRSSGFLVDRAHFIARLEITASRRYVALCRFGIDRLRTVVAGHGLACDWDESGWLHAAATAAGAAELPVLRAWLERLGEPYQWLAAADLERLTGTACYRAGIRLPGSVLVQPAALARGLAVTLPPAVEIYEESPVRSIERLSESAAHGRYRITAGAGSVEARHLFLATNGYTPGLGFLGRRLFPLLTFGSLTRRRTAAEQRLLAGEREWGLLSEDPMGSTLRRTRDQRLLVRNTVHFAPRLAPGRGVVERARGAHRRAFLLRFPALCAVGFEHTWTGLMGASPNRGHCFGEIDRGLFAAAGYTGAGIALGTAAGTLLADLALDAGGELLSHMLALPEPQRLPPSPWFDVGARLRVARMNAAAGEIL
jgi:glycine/D-amino acid oxidase-like deaminating enzyme